MANFKYEPKQLTQFNFTGLTVLNSQLIKLWQWLKAAFDTFTGLATAAPLTLYADSSAGSDKTGDGSRDKPYKTIAKLVGALPKTVNHAVVLNLTGSFTEPLQLTGFSGGGSITAAGPGGTGADGTKASVTYVQAAQCGIETRFYNLTAVNTGGIAFYAYMTRWMALTYCTATVAAPGQTGAFCTGSLMQMQNCTVSNRQKALYAANMGQIYSGSNSGTGNTYGLHAYTGGAIYKGNTTQPSGTTAEYCGAGGRILGP